MATSTIKRDLSSAFRDAANYSVDTTGVTINLGTGYRGVLFVLASSEASCGLYLIYTNNSGTLGYKAVSTSTILTITQPSTGNVNLKVSAGSAKALLIKI